LGIKYKKIRAANGVPLNQGAPCHGITGILVNPAMQASPFILQQSDSCVKVGENS